MTKLKIGGFSPDDDIEYDLIEFDIPWRNLDTGERGTEHFTCRSRAPLGTLLDVESGDRDASRRLVLKTLLTEDREMEEDDETGDPKPVVGTSSLERWITLTDDPERQVPGQSVSDVIRELYVEYMNRRTPAGAAARPTKSAGRSGAKSSRTGATSRGKQHATA